MSDLVVLSQGLSSRRNFITNFTFNPRRRYMICFDVSCYVILIFRGFPTHDAFPDCSHLPHQSSNLAVEFLQTSNLDWIEQNLVDTFTFALRCSCASSGNFWFCKLSRKDCKWPLGRWGAWLQCVSLCHSFFVFSDHRHHTATQSNLPHSDTFSSKSIFAGLAPQENLQLE